MMRVWIIPVLFLVFSGLAAAQDGGNIRYLDIGKVDSSIVGRTVHLDFYKNSFPPPLSLREERPAGDKILLDINGRHIEFVEHREDDGLNNWFNGQYLESSDKTMRITQFTVLKVSNKEIKVLAAISVEPFSKEFTFKKKDIVEVLVRVDR